MFSHISKNSRQKDAYICVKLQYAHSDSEIGYVSESTSTSQPWAVKR